MYIGAVAVLPTYAPLTVVLIERSTSLVFLVRLLEESKSGKQALREVRMMHMLLWQFPVSNAENCSLGRWRSGWFACSW